MLNSIPLARFQSLRRVVLAIFILLAVAVLLFCSSPPGYGDFHEYVEAVGLAMIAAGIIGRVWCTLYIGGRKSSEIVDKGPYSMSRNPLYFFSSLAAAGVGAETGSAVVGIFFGLITAAAFHVVILREEAHLAEHFDETYAAYRARVPRFWPNLTLFRDAENVTVAAGRLYSTLFDGLIFVAAVPIFELIEHLQSTGIVPVLVHLP